MNSADSEHFSLRWNNFHSNLSTGFHAMLEEVDLVDVTLAAEGQFVQAHKIVLSVCSPYFKQLFKVNPCKHPIVILKDVSHKELVAILQFMYQGEVNVRQEELAAFLKTAEMLQIKGLTGSDSPPSESPPPPPITQPVSRLRETVDPLRGLEETPQRTFKRKRVDPPVTSLISSNTTTTATVSPSPQILTDSSSSFDLSEIKKPKDEPIDYESDIEEIECKVISTDNSIAQLLQGETSQPLQESPQTSLNMFSSLAGLSQDSGGSQEGGQGRMSNLLQFYQCLNSGDEQFSPKSNELLFCFSFGY